MAQKRMFDKRVVESDLFTDLPNSSKALYFMAGMAADDRGFFQPRRLQKICGFTDDDFKILIAKRFFITFESGVMVVTDWNKNNWLDKRRINETEYMEELKLLNLINEKYELKDDGLANAKRMLRENRIEENSIVDNNKLLSYEQKNDDLKNEFEQLWSKYPNKKGKKDALKHYIAARKRKVDFETIDKGLDNYINYLKQNPSKANYIKHGSTWFNKECWNDVYDKTETMDELDIKLAQIDKWFEEE